MTSAKMTTKRNLVPTMLPAMAALWVVAIATGSWFMLRHEFEAGARVPAPSHLPPELAQIFPESKPLTLVVAIHPECPCTAASIEQIERLIARNRHSIQAVALFWTDGTAPKNSLSIENGYWERLAALPNVTVLADPGGVMAEKLGAVVSGSVAAYDAQGNLRFQGGLTASRGHAGSSNGMDAVEAIARGEFPSEIAETPAFGCALASEPNA